MNISGEVWSEVYQRYTLIALLKRKKKKRKRKRTRGKQKENKNRWTLYRSVKNSVETYATYTRVQSYVFYLSLCVCVCMYAVCVYFVFINARRINVWSMIFVYNRTWKIIHSYSGRDLFVPVKKGKKKGKLNLLTTYYRSYLHRAPRLVFFSRSLFLS